jgi:flagellar M-ring protein FliF
MLDQLRLIWKDLGMNQKVSLVVASLGILLVTVALLVWSSRPKMQLLYGGLNPEEMGEVTKTVDSMGVKYEIRNGGSSIYVTSSDVHQARMRLATEGLPSGGGVGYEIFDSGSFGISSFVQHTNFVRAIQGELARTINQLDGVNSSKVMIVIPENELLLTGPQKKPTASVFVDSGSRTLGLEAVDSIRSLVSNAVEGMSLNDVAVVDNKGKVLSEALRDDGAMGMTSSQIKFRKSVEDYYTQKVESMLARIVGGENVVVRVSVGLDMDMRTLVEEQFDPDAQVVRSENSTENNVISSETSKASVAGEEANTPGGTTTTGRDNVVARSEEIKKVKDTNYEINKTTIETIRNPGSIQQLNAAVFLALQFVDSGQGVLEPQPRSQEQMDRLQLMVVNALGMEYDSEEDLDRRVTIEEIEFSAPSYAFDGAGGAFDITTIIDASRSILAVAISVVMLMVFFRMIKNAAKSSDGLEVLPPEADNRASAGGSAGNGISAKDVTPAISPELLNELIKQNPDKVSSALKNWAFPDQ